MDDTQVTTTPAEDILADNDHHLTFDHPEENPKAHWYVIHTYAGQEVKTAATLKQKLETLNLDKYFDEILIPTTEKIKITKGKRSTIAEKIFPGYMLVKMELNDDSWLAVRTTAGITGFVGTGNKPTRLSPEEVEAIKAYLTQDTPKYTSNFSTGEAVKIADGPFADMLGTVSKIDEEKGKIHVLVSIFGRETPVELDFLQVSKI